MSVIDLSKDDDDFHHDVVIQMKVAFHDNL